MKNRLFLIVLSNILLAFVLVGGVVFAQDNPVAVDTGPGAESLLTNSISGRAVDGSGNGVAGVTVTATRVKYPIVFLPGVMGTFLRNEPRSDGDCASSNRPDGTIWLEKNAGQWQLDLGSLRLNSTGNGPNNNCDRISPDGRLALGVFLDSVKVADYAPYELFLRQAQEDHGFNVLPYDGYDWRLTLTDAVTKLDTFIDANRGSGGKVYLVAHSMGGLLARAYVADDARAEKVAGVVTVGTPYLGAPVMAQRMVTGKTGTPVDTLLDSTQIKEIIHRSPGIQQLLPTTAYVGGLSKGYYLPVTGASLNSYQEIADYFVQQNFLSGQTLDVAEAFHADLDGFDRNFYAQGRYAVLYTSDHETPSFIREKNCWFGWFGDEDDVCGIDVERRLMGDETVPIGSSNLDRLSSAARADVAFYKCEDSEQNFKTHGDLFLDNRIIEDVLHLLKGEAVEHCDIETTLQASAAPTGFRQYTVWGEGRVQVVDAQGNITGVDESGILVRNLDDVTYLFTNGGIIVTMPLDAAYTLVTHDTGSQPMQIVAADFALAPAGAAVAAEEYAAQAQAVFNNISSADGGTVTISAAGVALTQLTLTVDSNADGTPESTLPPDGVLTDPVQIQDSGMPTTTLVVAGTQDSEGKYTSAVTVALTAEDGESGILRSYISLDSGQTWQEYTSQVQFELPPGESTTLQAYSVDRAGNQEYPPIMRELSFNAITGPVAPAVFLPVVSGGQLMAAAQVELAAKVTSEPVAETPDQVIDPLMRSSERFVATTVYTVTTGADGRYTLTNLPAGDYVVRAARSGLNVTPSSQSVTVPPSQTDVNFTVTTTPTATPTATSIPPTATPSPGFNPAEEILIPAGSFQMGCDSSNSAETCASDEQPLHTVTLDAYSIDKYEVTNARYQACVAAGGCTAPESVNSFTRSPYYGTSTYADYPVINVYWHQASAFCAWAGKRLPTEAEWEKAARGSSDTRKYPWGNQAPDGTLLNFNWDVRDTTSVGSYPSGASPYGVMDMAGNVWEWVNDWYQSDYYSVSPGSNPQGPATGSWRVPRGGSWSSNDSDVRSANRHDLDGFPDFWVVDLGFRCVRSQ